MKTLNFKPLSRGEMRAVKGGTGSPCDTKAQGCNPACGHFSTGYSAFVSCMENNPIQGCSPLSEWYTVCGNYN